MVKDGWHIMLSEQVYVENGFVQYGKDDKNNPTNIYQTVTQNGKDSLVCVNGLSYSALYHGMKKDATL